MQKRYLADFERIRTFSDALPTQRVTAEDGDFKCRGNVMCGIAHRAENLLRQGIIADPTTVTEIQAYIDFIGQKEFSIFSTQEDIDAVNRTLNLLIQALS
ncbi:MAG: hypothetical protein Q7T74_02375 [Candidatus Saccharibacteria bacterium]|nr:hypothetical protein [Candidatus Saccharibacteria bacterium]